MAKTFNWEEHRIDLTEYNQRPYVGKILMREYEKLVKERDEARLARDELLSDHEAMRTTLEHIAKLTNSNGDIGIAMARGCLDRMDES